MNEFELIARLTADLPNHPSVVAGVGDDCAVLDLGVPDRWILFKTDAVVEEVHFAREAPAEKVGYKALARCLSDIAAMAGTPTHAVVTLGLPAKHDLGYVEAVYAGLKVCARQFGVAIVGGETTSSRAGLFLSLAVLGQVAKDAVVYRKGAQTGDAIFVTGELGGSLAGRHLDFVPRLMEARWLAQHFKPHAMIDLSDGLAGDLRHILAASGVGAELLQDALPISRAAKLRHRQHPSAKPPLEAALTDGEDFELLFTLASAQAVPLLDAWKKQFPEVKLSCIGKITASGGVRIRDRKGLKEMGQHGYTHFS